jgi:undecaprenyl-diphosphatase
MDLLHVIFLSIVEGVTEFLPISSTAHLILASHVLQIPKNNFLTTFEISIQLGAILSVVFLYFEKLYKNRNLLLKTLVGFVPTGILGLIFFKYIKMLLNDPFIPVASLFIGGIAIIGIEYYFKNQTKNSIQNAKSLKEMSYKDAFWIGLMQSISMIPGVSRAAASIFGGMALRFDRKSSVEFSFLLAIPTMTMATGYDLLQSFQAFTANEALYILIGITASFLSALIVVKWLIQYVQSNNFIAFGVYRIVLSVLYFLIFLR